MRKRRGLTRHFLPSAARLILTWPIFGVHLSFRFERWGASTKTTSCSAILATSPQVGTKEQPAQPCAPDPWLSSLWHHFPWPRASLEYCQSGIQMPWKRFAGRNFPAQSWTNFCAVLLSWPATWLVPIGILARGGDHSFLSGWRAHWSEGKSAQSTIESEYLAARKASNPLAKVPWFQHQLWLCQECHLRQWCDFLPLSAVSVFCFYSHHPLMQIRLAGYRCQMSKLLLRTLSIFAFDAIK